MQYYFLDFGAINIRIISPKVKENCFLPQDNLSAPEHVQIETTNDQFMQEIQQPQMPEEAEREYHNDIEGVENEEVDETPVVEVHVHA